MHQLFQKQNWWRPVRMMDEFLREAGSKKIISFHKCLMVCIFSCFKEKHKSFSPFISALILLKFQLLWKLKYKHKRSEIVREKSMGKKVKRGEEKEGGERPTVGYKKDLPGTKNVWSDNKCNYALLIKCNT